LLLLVSFERLSRYDFAQIQETSPGEQQQGRNDKHSVVKREEASSGEDHFLTLWAGMSSSSWERTIESGFFQNLIQFLRHITTTSSSTSKTPTSLSTKLLNYQGLMMSSMKQPIIDTTTPLTPLVELRRQRLRSIEKYYNDGHQVINVQKTKRSERLQTANLTTTSNTTATTTRKKKRPTIGFLLLLNTCDQHTTMLSHWWQEVWRNQIVDQPYLFHIVLTSSANRTCIQTLRTQFTSRSRDDDEELAIYRVTQDEQDAALVRAASCEHLSRETPLLNVISVRELLYCNGATSKLRLFQHKRYEQKAQAPSSLSSFHCASGGERPHKCEKETSFALDCPWFQYVSRTTRIGNTTYQRLVTPIPHLNAAIS